MRGDEKTPLGTFSRSWETGVFRRKVIWGDMVTPRTARLVHLAGTNANVRLSVSDREFLRDLSRVQLISTDLAARNHYAHLKGGSTKSLARLERAGLLSSKTL